LISDKLLWSDPLLLTGGGADGNFSHVGISTGNNRVPGAVVSRSKPAADRLEEQCARFEEACRHSRLRVTPQRLAVYRALAEDTGHPTAEAVYARLRPGMKSLSRATVYRTLESLESEGFIRRVSTTDGAARFEANLAPHVHLVCRVCGMMRDLGETPPPPSLVNSGLPDGFVVKEIDIRIVGTCRGCRRTGSPARAVRRRSVINSGG
jgi:Fur family peroxide stress response transcriptional regulator